MEERGADPHVTRVDDRQGGMAPAATDERQKGRENDDE
jgi:hypothetical protein